MKRFIEGTDRGQSTLFPECLEDWIDENNPVQVIDVFVDELDLAELGFDGITNRNQASLATRGYSRASARKRTAIRSK
jgi:transposase